ncbi:branched-chain-amino-acid transaminase [Bacillus horti]|uniref:Branched-chain-amino-acid aminotransferase n=1 Tax=Caldalkalibacillus horti TaxID=77523 RepID=A0ABT9W1Y6_9BACI|nr:branched-chain-amino-acid transaminase [Bacillus horti]MDQ0167251.1 branched-chain amino acid aminotransferase [Bacillus horti]
MGERLIYMSGKFVPQSEAKVSVFDHGFLYGDGIFEGLRVYEGNIYKSREHLIRLYESAKSIMLDIPMTIDELEEVMVETVKKNDLRNAYIRLVISRGPGDLGLDPFTCKNPEIIIIADQVRLFPQELYDKGLDIVTVPTRRNTPDALNPKIKSLNYLNNVLVKIEARRAGVLEALMLNHEGYVCEGSGDNIFLVKKGKLITPPTYLGALEGITRETVMELAKAKGYEVVETPFTRHDVYVADECFLTGTAAEVIPVISVDDRIVGDGTPGPVTKELIQSYRQVVTEDGRQVYPEKVVNITA